MGQRIDVHHHIVPPRWLAEETERLAARSAYLGTLKQWTPASAIESMDEHGIAVAITSLSTVITRPGDPGAASALARDCNEFAAGMVRDHPGRFGTFAHLPLPHVEACLKEIEYASETLKVDGFRLQSSYGDQWPGDPAFEPVFAELDRRGSVVFVHPTVPDCCLNTVPGVIHALMEFPFDTTRAIASLLFAGTFTRYPRIRFIFSHGGGTLPMLAHRIVELARPGGNPNARADPGAREALRKLYFDIVSVTNRPAMAALREFSGTSRLLFGTDAPYMRIGTLVSEFEALGLEAPVVAAIERENALALMSRTISSNAQGA
jgi:predicted TIM-barrel fold metal-dependent hydrolase